MAGTFDSEIRQAMTPDGAAPAPKAKSAPSKGAVAEPTAKAAPPKPPAALPTVQNATMPHMQGMHSDPVAHAAGIAHAILRHSGGGGVI